MTEGRVPEPTVSDEFKLLLSDFYFRLEERDRWADQFIKYLLYGNGGGIALLLAFIGGATRSGQTVDWLMILPLICFARGVQIVGTLIREAGSSTRTGRNSLRNRMNLFVKGETTFEAVFLEMGTEGSEHFPSKWKHFDGCSRKSSRWFAAGAVSSVLAFLIWPVLPWSHHAEESVQLPVPVEIVGTGTPSRPLVSEAAASLPSGGAHQAAGKAGLSPSTEPRKSD